MGAGCCGHHGHNGRGQNPCGQVQNQPDTDPIPPGGTGGGASFRVTGMCCAEEVASLRAEIGPLVGGGDNLAFDVLHGRMIILNHAPTDDVIIAAVARTGMKAVPWMQANSGDEPHDHRRHMSMLAAVSGVATGLGWGADLLGAGVWPSRLAFGCAVLVGLWVVLPKAWLAIRRVRTDMNLLMSVAVAGAMLLGDWLEAATVSFLFALSLALESWSAGRARSAIAALMDLTPTEVRVRQADGQETRMAPDDVAVGGVFIVHPGERIPLDGLVLRGESVVDQAPITGESLPVAKSAGSGLFAGTINGDGVLEVENTRSAQDTTLARITRMVATAQSNRSTAERWVDRFAAIYTPVVMALSVLVLMVPPLVLGAEWGEWFYRALVLLVIACPCALVISTPVTVVAAMAAAARAGVLVKGGEYLERPARLKAIAFDKTGTLTVGRPVVGMVVPLNGHMAAEVLAHAAALEARNVHPIALAIVNHAESQGICFAPAQNVRAIPGMGASGTIDGQSYWLGSCRFLTEQGAATPELLEQARQLEQAGQSVVAVGSGQRVLGLIALSDRLRSDAKQVLSALRWAGVEHLVMLTGDNWAAAQQIAAGLGIDQVQAELLPADKVAAVEDLVTRYGIVAMVGDGVNDAPAMVKASLGIAMGAIGTDTAIETADLALMSDDLGRLVWLMDHSRRMLSVLRQNVGFALGIKLVFTLLAFAGIATLWGAIAADMGASLLVVFNGLRMLRQDGRQRLGKSAIPS